MIVFQLALVGLTAFLISTQSQQQSRCELTSIHDARRQEAIAFVVKLNALQSESHRRTGTFVGLADLAISSAIPVGFVPRLVFDRWTYVVTLADLFDKCGFTLMSDERGIVYEARPVTPVTAGDGRS